MIRLVDLPDRIQDKIMPEPMSGCWIWIGARCNGYGTKFYSSKTHCPKGHPYSGENLYYWSKRPNRQCKICHAANQRAYLIRKTNQKEQAC